jgi:ABC-type bacteriocin/lantibiotic exporter with double-glycine peptidase domain
LTALLPPFSQILIDGKDIATLHLKTLRSQIGLVSQVTVLSSSLFLFSFPSPVHSMEALCTTVDHNYSCSIGGQLEQMGSSI